MHDAAGWRGVAWRGARGARLFGAFQGRWADFTQLSIFGSILVDRYIFHFIQIEVLDWRLSRAARSCVSQPAAAGADKAEIPAGSGSKSQEIPK